MNAALAYLAHFVIQEQSENRALVAMHRIHASTSAHTPVLVSFLVRDSGHSGNTNTVEGSLRECTAVLSTKPYRRDC